MIVSALAMLSAWADPCGMVPPIYTGTGPEPVGIERQGLQNTYVFFDQGIETIAIRPGFTGTVEQFGMLVPLPSVPALHKIDDRTFTQLEHAVDPAMVNVHIVQRRDYEDDMMPSTAGAVNDGGDRETRKSLEVTLDRNQVRVVKEEAIGMYEVAVLEAGSPEALQRWMTKNRFRYPNGMDAVVEDFVQARWMFVAVKSRVNALGSVDARPGLREVVPKQGTFDGYVQGMAFRFRTNEAVIPMRLSTYNGNDTHNRVYVLTNGSARVAQIDTDLVRRQVRTEQLYNNVMGPLPIAYHGPVDKIDAAGWRTIKAQRDATPYVSVVRALFGADLLSVRTGELSLPFEERENEFLRISESVGLRGSAIDRLHHELLDAARQEATEPLLRNLSRMTLTVLDGDFPRGVIREQNLTLARYDLPADRNRKEVFGFQHQGPTITVEY